MRKNHSHEIHFKIKFKNVFSCHHINDNLNELYSVIINFYLSFHFTLLNLCMTNIICQKHYADLFFTCKKNFLLIRVY